jgi:hypothetical protein
VGKQLMFKLEFETDDDAFQNDNFSSEVERILKAVTERVKRGDTEGKIRDNNGNAIGTFSW